MNNDKDSLGKFDEAIFLGYFTSSKIFRVFNKRTLIVKESIHVVFDKTNDLPSKKIEDADNAGIIKDGMKELTINNSTSEIKNSWKKNMRMRVSMIKIFKNNLKIQVIF